jgi:hypothetical protein
MGIMFTIEPTNPESFRTYLATPLRAAKLALDDGVSWAETILHDRSFDPWLWSHLVRYHARGVLNTPSVRDWGLTPSIPHSGIEITKGPLTVRVLKSLRDAPPNPGHSGSRRAFYQQCLQLDFDGAPLPASGGNLILDWSVDRRNLDLTLGLSKPVDTWPYGGRPQLEWRLIVTFDNEYPTFKSSDDPLDIDPSEELTDRDQW